MYCKQSLLSCSYISKLSLWLLFGCSILSNELYASENSISSTTEVINALDCLYGQGEEEAKKALIDAIKEGNRKRVIDLLSKKQDMNLSEEQKVALRLLFDLCDKWLLKMCMNKKEMPKFIEAYLAGMYLSSFINEGTDLTDENYLKNLADKLENFKQGYQDIVLATSKSLMFKSHITLILYKNLLEQLNNLSEKLPKGLNLPDESTPSVSNLKEDMENFFQEVRKNLETQQDTSSTDTLLDQDKHSKDVDAAFKEVEAQLRKAVENLQSALSAGGKEGILSYCNEIMSCIECLYHLCNNQPIVDCELIKASLQGLFDAVNIISCGQLSEASSTYKNNPPRFGPLLGPLALFFSTLKGQIMGCLGRPKQHIFSQDSSKLPGARDIASLWRNCPNKMIKGGVGAAIMFTAGYKIYKKHFTKPKKASTTTSASSAFSHKKGLLFILCLLLGGLLMVGIFYRKKNSA